MSALQIIQEPNPDLRKVAEPILTITAKIRELVSDMIETMHKAGGIGLAAPQISVNVQLFVVSGDVVGRNIAVINPNITRIGDAQCIFNEGCLSVAERHVNVERPCKVRVQFLDVMSKRYDVALSKLAAVVFQHEGDHLNGRLISDLQGSCPCLGYFCSASVSLPDASDMCLAGRDT